MILRQYFSNFRLPFNSKRFSDAKSEKLIIAVLMNFSCKSRVTLMSRLPPGRSYLKRALSAEIDAIFGAFRCCRLFHGEDICDTSSPASTFPRVLEGVGLSALEALIRGLLRQFALRHFSVFDSLSLIISSTAMTIN